MNPDSEIQIGARVVAVAAARLEELIARHCPGPHGYVQHRDRKPPWCPACRYTEAGVRIPDRQEDA